MTSTPFLTNSTDAAASGCGTSTRPGLGLLIAYALLRLLATPWVGALAAVGPAPVLPLALLGHPVVGAALVARHGRLGLGACAAIELAVCGLELATRSAPFGAVIGLALLSLVIVAGFGQALRPELGDERLSQQPWPLSRSLRLGLRMALAVAVGLLVTRLSQLAPDWAAGASAELWFTWAGATLLGPLLIAPVTLAMLGRHWPWRHRAKLGLTGGVGLLAGLGGAALVAALIRAQAGVALPSEAMQLGPFWVLMAVLSLTGVLLGAELVLLEQGSRSELEARARTLDLKQSEAMLTYAVEMYHQQSEQLGAILNALPIGCAAFDAEGQNPFLNRQMQTWLAPAHGPDRVPLTDFLGLLCRAERTAAQRQSTRVVPMADGKHAADTAHPPVDAAWQAAAVLTDRQLRKFDAAIGAGPTRRFALRVLRFDDGPLNCMLLLEDITDQEQLERSKAQFLKNAAHEIRTPLTVIAGQAELLGLFLPQGDARLLECAAGIRSKSLELNELLTHMLHLAELDARGEAALQCRPVDLNALVPNALRGFVVPPGRLAPICLPAPEPCWVLGDPVKLARAIQQLLSNAYAHSAAPQPVTLTLTREPTARAASAGGGHVTLRIRDHGIGMSAEQTALACERFYRVDPSGQRPGFGLGLSYVQQLLRLHHGQLQIDSQPGVGTEVALRLPLQC